MSPVLLNPTGVSAESQSSLAPRRIRDLNGKTVALLHSTKHNSDRVLDALAELLESRWAVKKVIRDRKPTFARPVPAEQARALADQADLVLTGIGD
jgi:predicted GTPase